MTLKNSILYAFVAITLASVTAGAYIVPGNPPRPAPPAPFPGRDDFGGGVGGGGYGRQEQKIVYLGRRVVQETLHLRQLAGIGENYRGYRVESVRVDVRRSGPRAELALLTDGRLEESVYSPQGSVVLEPRFSSVIGEDFRSLQLDVRGQIEIDSITINLVEGDRYNRPDRPDRPERPGRTLDVPLYVMRRLYGNDRLDLTSYVDMNRYRGYRIEAIELEASPVYNTAMLDLLINGFNQGRTLQIDRYNSLYTITPMNAVLGMGADSIVLYSRGDLDVRQVTLRLSRR